VVYVGGMPFIGRQFEEFKRPRSGWVVQRYNPTSKKWDRIPASATPIQIRTSNLLIGRVPEPDEGVMTLSVKSGPRYNGRTNVKDSHMKLDPNRRSSYGSGLNDSALTD
jgi:hypothetical protein